MINPIYLKKETIKELKLHYESNRLLPSVSLTQFLTSDALEQILDEVINTNFERDDQPLSFRRLTAPVPSLVNGLFASQQFINIVEKLTGVSSPISNISFYKYGHTDYEIIYDDDIDPPGLDVVIDLTPKWEDQFGGYVAYTDGEGELFTLPSGLGTISIVNRSDKFYRFVKYVNVYAGNLKRYMIFASTVEES